MLYCTVLYCTVNILLSQVRWLLKHGAKIRSDKYGKTPLSDAAENKQLEVNRYKCILLDEPASLDTFIYSYFPCSGSVNAGELHWGGDSARQE